MRTVRGSIHFIFWVALCHASCDDTSARRGSSPGSEELDSASVPPESDASAVSDSVAGNGTDDVLSDVPASLPDLGDSPELGTDIGLASEVVEDAAPIPCESSKECPGKVCWKEAGVCVDCLSDADCGSGTCREAHICIPSEDCQSDKDCSAAGLVCDTNAGICVDCVAHTDCPDSEHCLQHACTADVCPAGAQQCVDGAPSTCSAEGEGWTTGAACVAGTGCVVGASGASCSPLVCVPGKSCDGTTLVVCDPSGQTVLSTTNCASQGLVCAAGECTSTVCTPGVSSCTTDQLSLIQCNTEGSAFQSTACAAGKYCTSNDGTAACVPVVCQPGKPYCSGGSVGQCNAAGSGPDGPLTGCVSGACEDGKCTDQVCAPGSSWCDENYVAKCSSDGMIVGYEDACQSDLFCGPLTSGDIGCHWCPPGISLCIADEVVSCSSGGVQGPSTPCQPGTACSGGECLPIVCEPGTRLCVGATSTMECLASGTGYGQAVSCLAGTACVDGVCQEACSLSCVDRECGPDACDGLCGLCESGTCNSAGHCVADCKSSCLGKKCGPDGCGGSCGTCGVGLTCDNTGTCKSLACVPDCLGRACGPDGCGGTCGSCSPAVPCVTGGQCGSHCMDCGAPCTRVDFASGHSTGWQTYRAKVTASFGNIVPLTTPFMLALSTEGSGPEETSAEATLDLCLPPGAWTVRLKWRFASFEFQNFCGTEFQDSVLVTVAGDGWSTTLLDFTIDDLCHYTAKGCAACPNPESGSCECGKKYVGLSQIGLINAQGDTAYAPNWNIVQKQLTIPAGGATVTLAMSVSDGGSDSLRDSILLIESLLLEPP